MKLEIFTGGHKKYKAWKKLVNAQQKLYNLEDSELAMLMYLSTKDDARDTADQMELDEMHQPGGLRQLWAYLEEAYGEPEDELFEQAEEDYASFRRTGGMSVARYLTTLKRYKNAYLKQDPGSTISGKAFAQRMLNRAGLSRNQRHDVFYNAGAAYDSRAIEKVLRRRCANIHQEDAKRGPAPSQKPSRRPTRPKGFYDQRQRPRSSSRSMVPYRGPKKAFRRRPKGIHFAEDEEDLDEGEEEDVTDDDDSAEGQDLEAEFEADEQRAYVAAEADEDTDSQEERPRWADMESDGEASEEEVSLSLKEAWAAGWKAKNKVAAQKKARKWSKPNSAGGNPKASQPIPAATDPRKEDSVCSSCLKRGHWHGDPECENVKSGQDKPHQSKGSGKKDSRKAVPKESHRSASRRIRQGKGSHKD